MKLNTIYGINAVYESLLNDRVSELYLQEGFSNSRILDLAKQKHLKIVFLSKSEFGKRYKGSTQGCVALTIPYKTYSLDEILSSRRKDSLIVILDELNDPHNLGAILRSSDVFGVDAVIFKKNNQVALNETVAKVSTGAINYVKCCEVTNLNQTIRYLKENGFWVIGLDGSAKDDLNAIPRDCPLAIVVGSEGHGIARLTKENCDLIVKIPMKGHVSCLNASVSCAIVLYQINNR